MPAASSAITTFRLNNLEYRVDTAGVAAGGLYRQNAMTYYEGVTEWAIVARNVTDNRDLFYLVKCKHPNENYWTWVQVSTDLGENIVGPFRATTANDDDDTIVIDDDDDTIVIDE